MRSDAPAPVTDVRARFAAAARQRTALETEIAARADVGISTRLHYVALYFELIGFGGLAIALLVSLLFPRVISMGLGPTHVSFASRAMGLGMSLVVYGGYAANGWLLRRRRRAGAIGAALTPALAIPVIGLALLASVWQETE